MKIKLLISRAGADFVQSPGDIIDVGDAEAGRMIEAGQAVPHVVTQKETATKKPPSEKAVKV